MKEQELRERMAVGEENWWEELQTIAEEPKEEENQAWAVQAVEKLEKEAAEANTIGMPKEALKELLVCRFQEASELARVSLLESRRFEDCMEYLKREVGKLLSHKSGAVEDRVVLEIMERYYRTQAEEFAAEKEKHAKEQAKREEEQRKRAEQMRSKLQKKEQAPTLFDMTEGQA